MKVYPLTIEEQTSGFTHRIRVTHEDLTETTASTAQTIAVLSVVDGDIVTDAAVRLVTPLKDASDTDFNSTAITVGDGGDAARYIASMELNENGSEVLAKGHVASKVPYAYVADDTVDVVVNSMAAKSLSNIDVGQFDVYLQVKKTAKLSREGSASE